MNAHRTGLAYALAAFLFWGMAPLYFKAVTHVPPAELLGHRVVWAVLLLAGFVWALRAWKPLTRRTVAMLVVSAGLISVNWLVYIYAIQTDRLMEASLGYYINPLLTMVLGMFFLQERLRPFQWVAVGLAVAGTAWLAVGQGGLPWIALVLACSFAFYGLVRKTIAVDSLQGLFIETLMLLPFALSGLAWLGARGEGAFLALGPANDLLLVAAGLVTAIPLFCFTQGARRLPMITLGFMQYLAPTIGFLIAVFVFGEYFGVVQAVAFSCIWTAIAIYIGGTLWIRRRAAAWRELEARKRESAPV